MKRFKTHLNEQKAVDLQELNLPFAIDNTLASIARRSGLKAVSNVLTDVFESGIRLVGRNPLKTAFFALALDQLVNSGKGRQALINYLRGDFQQHSEFVIDAIFALMDSGIDPKTATGLVATAVEAAT